VGPNLRRGYVIQAGFQYEKKQIPGQIGTNSTHGEDQNQEVIIMNKEDSTFGYSLS